MPAHVWSTTSGAGQGPRRLDADQISASAEEKIMTATVRTELSRRDVAVLRAVAAGRCELVECGGPVLTVDGRCFCDQLAAPRLAGAGLIVGGTADRLARLTPAGAAVLRAA
jgi:hypothetical protein